MNKKAIISIEILMIVFVIFLFIGKIKDKKENEVVNEFNSTTPTELAEETTTTITTTIATRETTQKTTKKTTKRKTERTTKKVIQPKSTATGSKAEYIQYAKEYGNLNGTQLACLDYLWSHESGWNPNSVNKSSGACGIPQALPCNKIVKQQGSNDWKAQIRWGINYINGRYKNPCSAWNHFKNKRWY